MAVNPPRTFMYWGTSADSQTFAVPYPAYDSSVFETQRLVDSMRNNYGEVVATQVGRSSDKQNMSWKVLSPSVWWEMNNFLEANGMFFWCRYFSFNTGTWKVRQFYVGDISAQPFMVSETTHRPKYMRECNMNVIDMGVLGQ